MTRTDEVSPAPVLALVRDLLLGSRVAGACRTGGVGIEMVRDPVALQNRPGKLLIADLNLPGAIEAAAAWAREAEGREVVGFVAHVDAATVSAARAAGIPRVMARSAFFAALPTILDEFRSA